MRYRLICLDAGFTLIRPRQTMAERLRDVLRQHGHRAGDEELRRAWEAAEQWFWEEYHAAGNPSWRSDDTIAQTWRAYHSLMLRQLGFADHDHRLLDAVIASQLSPDAWELYEDVEPALRRLRQPRHDENRAKRPERPAIAIVSDWESSLEQLVDRLGLRRYVDFVLASGAEGVAKPSPEFFLLACERAGARAQDALMIGDSYRADVLGARAAGMDAVLLDRNGSATDVETGIPVVRTLLEAAEAAFPPTGS